MKSLYIKLKRKIKNRKIYGLNNWLSRMQSKSKDGNADIQMKRDVPETNLEKLGEKYKPSKRNHDYLYWYDIHFNPFKNTAKKLLK